MHKQMPKARGLYDPANEHDSCGVGFVANIRGEASHQIILDAAVMLRNMDHRGACGAEPNTGDGAGMLTALPHGLFAELARDELGVTLPEPGRYAVGNIFLPPDEQGRRLCKEAFKHYIKAQGQQLLGWRPVPVDTQ
ncbi:MAG: hypothetical protein L0H83_04895, partial [Salinisphaera sp.]|nr:hypothetical protein [Salinisphaera sp.]